MRFSPVCFGRVCHQSSGGPGHRTRLPSTGKDYISSRTTSNPFTWSSRLCACRWRRFARATRSCSRSACRRSSIDSGLLSPCTRSGSTWRTAHRATPREARFGTQRVQERSLNRFQRKGN